MTSHRAKSVAREPDHVAEERSVCDDGFGVSTCPLTTWLHVHRTACQHPHALLLSSRSALIGQLNWADTLLYAHFNRTLFDKIALEEDFYEEVAELKAQVKVRGGRTTPGLDTSASYRAADRLSWRQWWSLKCQDFDKWDEDAHRVQLEERDISDDMKLCHYMWLDSKGKLNSANLVNSAC